MLLDANILLYAIDQASPHHKPAASWLTETLNGTQRVALPWQTIGAFVRISTHPRISENPLSGAIAWGIVETWLSRELIWIPPTSERTARIFGDLVSASGATGNLVTDAQLAALAIEHGLPVVSADTDFDRFTGVRRINPILA
jgi:toxin-antitoxin system PIN domain toxin